MYSAPYECEFGTVQMPVFIVLSINIMNMKTVNVFFLVRSDISSDKMTSSLFKTTYQKLTAENSGFKPE